MRFKIPHKPDCITTLEWEAILNRHKPPICENWADGICAELHGALDQDGEIPLSDDHRQARSKGGEDSARNCRLICHSGCKESNLVRGAGEDTRWRDEFWFDRHLSYAGLRAVQVYCGPQLIKNHAELFTSRDKRNNLLTYCSLFVLTTGAGKTMLTVSLLLAINSEVLRRTDKGPRVGRALWFVKDTTSADQLEAELEKEVQKYGLHQEAPRILKCTQSGDLAKGYAYHDITIACPQAVWDRENQPRTDDQIREILNNYDAIVFDECDWAHAQLGRIVTLATHALKFGLTATPINADGGVISKHFILATSASYALTFELDRCLKIVPTWESGKSEGYIVPVQHSAHTKGVRGQHEYIEAAHNDKDSLPGQLATVHKAIMRAEQLEREMKITMPDDWYSPHILIRCSTIKQANSLTAQIEELLSRLKRQGELSGDGWRTAMMYQGVKHRYIVQGGEVIKKSLPDSSEEKYLIHDAGTSKRAEKIHPWLLAKESNNGRCADKSARILIVIDIGVRGLNNWTCLINVDINRSSSISEQVQFDGRTHRIPNHLKKYLDIDRCKRFVTAHLYYPDANGTDWASTAEARRWVHTMEEQLEKSGLPTWRDLLYGDATENALTDPDLNKKREVPFTEADRTQIDNELGQRINDGISIEDLARLSDEEINQIVNQLPPEITNARREAAVEHIRSVTQDEEYRKKFICVPARDPVCAVLKETQLRPDQYEDSKLEQFVNESLKVRDDLRAGYLQRIRDEDQFVRNLIGALIYEDEKQAYIPPVKIRRLNGEDSIVSEIGGAITNALLKNGVYTDFRANIGSVIKAVNCALQDVFDVENAGNDGPLDQPGYHHKICSPTISTRIEKLTYIYLAKWGRLGAASSLYGGRDEE